MWIDAVETARQVRDGELSAANAVEQAIGRAKAVNPRINAVVESTFDQARDQARSQQPNAGPLAGVPILLKDLFCPVQGDPAYQGNRTLRALDHRYPTTGSVARRLADAGTISIGRSHSPELGCGQAPAAAETDAYGPARNPWDTDRSPLGSSGGASAAVAAGIVPVAHASDGGGSIRIPASANGLVGLKPTRGRISSAPAGELWAGGVIDGVVSRTVRDTAAFLDVLAGPEAGDPHLAPPFAGSWLDALAETPPPMRIAVCSALPYAEIAPECVEAVDGAAAVLESLGHGVEVGHPEAMDRLDYMYDYIRVIRVSLAAEMAELVKVLGRDWSADDVEEGTWINYQRGRKVSGPDYVASRDRLHAFTRAMVSWWGSADEGGSGFDLLLTPTLGTPPPPVGHLVAGADERELTRRLAEVTPFMPQFNVTGQPAISVPLHQSDDGLPIGVQLVAAPGREDLLLQISAQLEKATPWIDRTPPVFAA